MKVTVSTYERRDGKVSRLLKRNKERDSHLIIRHCWQCGQVYYSARKHSKYCASACRQKAYRRRKSLAKQVHNLKVKQLTLKGILS